MLLRPPAKCQRGDSHVTLAAHYDNCMPITWALWRKCKSGHCYGSKCPSIKEFTMDIEALQRDLRAFAAARQWQPFHTPKNLSAALLVEAAELLEIFQWMTAEESQAAQQNPLIKAQIADEVADVLLYLLQLADHCAIDLPSAVTNKLVKNAIKHPAPAAVDPQP
jgi:NTP pyrophosphatase (non-canonical NTP hydrolase)